MIDFEKKLKAGLRKCPLHEFYTLYKPVGKNFYECEKCKGFYEMENNIVEDEDFDETLKVKIAKPKEKRKLNYSMKWEFL